jgi:phage shock protein C
MDSTTEPATTRLTKDAPDPAPSGDPSVPPYLAPVPEPTTKPKFRLRRSRTDRMLGGVCGGLAESLGVDAAVIRIGLVTLTVLGFGMGIVIYAAIWMLAPETDEP